MFLVRINSNNSSYRHGRVSARPCSQLKHQRFKTSPGSGASASKPSSSMRRTRGGPPTPYPLPAAPFPCHECLGSRRQVWWVGWC
eukprot:SAG25_NODE_217_length_11656_cov_91.443108_14_plen_85_part_00